MGVPPPPGVGSFASFVFQFFILSYSIFISVFYLLLFSLFLISPIISSYWLWKNMPCATMQTFWSWEQQIQLPPRWSIIPKRCRLWWKSHFIGKGKNETVASLFQVWKGGWRVYYPGGLPTCNGLYEEAPSERGTFVRLEVYKRVGI